MGAGVPSIGSIGAEQKYEINVPGSLETSQRSISIGGDEYQVSHISSRAPGNDIPVDVIAPDGKDYDVYLYDSDKNIQNTKSGSGNGRVTFDTDGMEAGTYILAIYADGEFENIFPVVISRYSVSLDGPAEVYRGEEIEMTVSVSGGEDDPAEVNVFLVSETAEKRVKAVKQGDGTFLATVSADSVPSGEYSVYAAAQGTKIVDGRKEILGISDANDVDVVEASETTQPSQGGTGGTGGTGGGSGAQESTTTGTPTATVTSTATSTPTATATTVTTTLTATETDTETATETTTDSGVITANEDTETTTTTSSEGQPGFGPVAALVALLSLATIAVRRS